MVPHIGFEPILWAFWVPSLCHWSTAAYVSHLRTAVPRAASLTIISRSGRGTSSKTHHPLWNEYTLRTLTQRSTSADTLPIALFSFLVHLRKHRASFNVGADTGLGYRTRTYNFLLVRETRFHCVNPRYVWWSMPGSNRPPQACKASALPTMS